MMTEHGKHSKDSEEAMHEADRHNAGIDEAVPAGAHGHSSAAHLRGGTEKEHTMPVGDRGKIEEKEESNREAGRAGETHRGQ